MLQAISSLAFRDSIDNYYDSRWDRAFFSSRVANRTGVASDSAQRGPLNRGVPRERLWPFRDFIVSSDSVDLAGQWTRGDEQAATELFDRYASRLIAVARRSISERLAQRVDPEDVVQSACRSVFSGLREGKYLIERGGDLWRLLAKITISKVRKQAETHLAQKRSMDREHRGSSHDNDAGFGASREPSPEDVAQMVDLLQTVMKDLDPVQQRMLELRLQGYRLEEVAVETQRSERTVRRLLEFVRNRWVELQG